VTAHVGTSGYSDVAAGWPNSTTVSAEWEFTACMRSDTGGAGAGE
jgi:hypothetical protein